MKVSFRYVARKVLAQVVTMCERKMASGPCFAGCRFLHLKLIQRENLFLWRKWFAVTGNNTVGIITSATTMRDLLWNMLLRYGNYLQLPKKPGMLKRVIREKTFRIRALLTRA